MLQKEVNAKDAADVDGLTPCEQREEHAKEDEDMFWYYVSPTKVIILE